MAYVFGHNSAIFWTNQTENFHGNSRDYYLSISDKKSKLWCLFFIFVFFGPFLAGKWAWPLCAPLTVWGLRTQTKCWPTVWSVDLLSQPLFRNHVVVIFRPEPENCCTDRCKSMNCERSLNFNFFAILIKIVVFRAGELFPNLHFTPEYSFLT